jgi:hypothetical protein
MHDGFLGADGQWLSVADRALEPEHREVGGVQGVLQRSRDSLSKSFRKNAERPASRNRMQSRNDSAAVTPEKAGSIAITPGTIGCIDAKGRRPGFFEHEAGRLGFPTNGQRSQKD